MAEVHDDHAEARADIETGALLSRLRVIEDQPLDRRAAAFVQLHDRLHSTLEGGENHYPHG